MLKPNIEELLNRYKNGHCTEEEQSIIENWYANWNVGAFDLSEQELLTELALIKEALPHQKESYTPYFRMMAAAIAVVILGIAFYFFVYHDLNIKGKNGVAATSVVKIVPGSNKAILTLADGSSVVLDGKTKMDAIVQHGVKVQASANGQLSYINDKNNEARGAFNSVTTPKGGQYEISLPDGTKVWLNAESKIRFPIVFGGIERNVDLVGEAYFEVAKDKVRPFKLKSAGQEITVLGTHFNVNAYRDETWIKTTLLEGKIKVNKGAQELMLVPGDQAINNEGPSPIVINKGVDVEESVAWKNGLFMFERESIFSIMKKISRWYDVEIAYHGDLRGKRYSGNISKFEEVTEVLNTMQLTGTIHFKIEGRRVTVMP